MRHIIFALTFLMGGYANAGFIAEPFIGYESGNIKGKLVGSTTESKSATTGFAYGARLSYKFSSLWMGVDYKGSAGSDDSVSKSDISTAVIGGLLGYQFDKVNVWGGYGFSDKFTVKNTSELEFSGSSFKVGFNYQTPHKINAGIEVAIPTYKKVKSSTGEADLDQLYSSFSFTSVMFMVSYPFGDVK